MSDASYQSTRASHKSQPAGSNRGQRPAQRAVELQGARICDFHNVTVETGKVPLMH